MSFLEKVHNDGLIIQLKELLEEYPEIRYYEMDRNSYPSKKTGYNSKSFVCTGCELNNTQIFRDGHSKTCIWVKSKRNFTKIYNQLSKFEKENFEYILQELNN